MKKLIELRVNGVVEKVYVEPWSTLAQVLREELGFTGTKISCETGDCGACTVNIDDKAVRSCIYPVMKAQGKDIVTIEGLEGEGGSLHPIQQSFIDHFAVQCGYCTPGMVMGTRALLKENPHPTEAEIKEGLRGNLCRCTGYNKIIDAVSALADSNEKGL